MGQEKAWAIAFFNHEDGQPRYWRGGEDTDLDYSPHPKDARRWKTAEAAQTVVDFSVNLGAGRVVELPEVGA